MRGKLAGLALSALLPLCAVGCGTPKSAEPSPLKPNFGVRAEVLESLENGPLVVRATLTNRGGQAVQIYSKYFANNAYLEPPDSWEFRSHITSSTSGMPWGIV